MNCKYPDNNLNSEEAVASRHCDPGCNTKPSCCDPIKYCRPYDPELSPCPYPILFQCDSNKQLLALPTAIPTVANTIRRRNIISLDLDTRCLKSPCVNVDFNTTVVIDYTKLAAPGSTMSFSLTFELIKNCNRNKTLIDTSTFLYTVTDGFLGAPALDNYHIELPFSIKTCDCNSKPCDETYTVRLVDLAITETPAPVAPAPSTITRVNSFALRDSSITLMAKSTC